MSDTACLYIQNAVQEAVNGLSLAKTLLYPKNELDAKVTNNFSFENSYQLYEDHDNSQLSCIIKKITEDVVYYENRFFVETWLNLFNETPGSSSHCVVTTPPLSPNIFNVMVSLCLEHLNALPSAFITSISRLPVLTSWREENIDIALTYDRNNIFEFGLYLDIPIYLTNTCDNNYIITLPRYPGFHYSSGIDIQSIQRDNYTDLLVTKNIAIQFENLDMASRTTVV